MRFKTFIYAAENDLLLEQKGGLKFISKQKAVDRGLFGPVYHGTTEDVWALIKQEGFKTIIDVARAGDVRNGYELTDYAEGNPPPVHHLGYGLYFTTSKAIAKQFNNNTMKGLIEFYLNVPRLEKINYAAPHTMMKWWMSNGYDMPDNWQQMPPMKAEEMRMKATLKMTRNLKKEFDAVWFTAKSIGRANLDGDQVCVYDPKRIFAIDPKMAKGLEVGAKVVHNQLTSHHIIGTHGAPLTYTPPPNVKGVIVRVDPINPKNAEWRAEHGQAFPKGSKHQFTVKWAKGGTQYGYVDPELTPVN